VSAAPSHRRGDDPESTGAELFSGPTCELARDFVKKTQLTGVHGYVIVQPEGEQNCFFEPLVCNPLVINFLRDPEVAGIELGQDVFDGLPDFDGRIAR
jgi:hypothetical protein